MGKLRSTGRYWSWVNYSISPLSCDNCSYSLPNEWVNDVGKCGVVTGSTFSILRKGICRLHSAFGGGNVKVAN